MKKLLMAALSVFKNQKHDLKDDRIVNCGHTMAISDDITDIVVGDRDLAHHYKLQDGVWSKVTTVPYDQMNNLITPSNSNKG